MHFLMSTFEEYNFELSVVQSRLSKLWRRWRRLVSSFCVATHCTTWLFKWSHSTLPWPLVRSVSSLSRKLPVASSKLQSPAIQSYIDRLWYRLLGYCSLFINDEIAHSGYYIEAWFLLCCLTSIYYWLLYTVNTHCHVIKGNNITSSLLYSLFFPCSSNLTFKQ